MRHRSPAAATRKESRLGCATRSKALAALVLALACSTAGAQDTEARVKALEAKVEQLTKRLDALEGRTTPTSTAPTGCPGMDRLRMNMMEAELRAVLGTPTRIDATPLQERWRYPCGTAYIDVQTRRFVGFEK